MKIVCAETVLLGREAFSNAGTTVVIPDREITRDDLLDADALLVRSKTKTNAELLGGTPVQFVGSATAGTDHMDTAWLESNGFYWCASPGCNANSVSEYVIAALLVLGRRHGLDLESRTIGVIGCGQVGSRVAAKCEALGMRVLRNDPPLAALALADERLGHAQPFRQLLLRHALPFPDVPEQLQTAGVIFRVDGLRSGFFHNATPEGARLSYSQSLNSPK